jgi:predicted TIM-barrel fold metal-dependent hydrolase
MGLIDGKLVAIDGTKLKASNSKKNHINLDTLNKKIQYIESRIDEYMHLLVNADDENVEESTVTALEMVEIKNKIEAYNCKKEKLEKLQEDMNAKGIMQVSFTDPDSRSMKNNGKAEVCYNVQSAVDSKYILL